MSVSLLMKKFLLKVIAPLPYPFKKLVYDIWCRTTEAGRTTNRGERFVVSSWKEMIESGEFQHLHHANRYWWAGKQIPIGNSVCDYGCGSGYGSWYLANQGNLVLGMDISEEAIGWAKKRFRHKSLQFDFVGSSHGVFDTIVCFEVIEHVRDPKSFLEMLGVMMTDNETLLISTANGSEESVRQWLMNNRLATVNPEHEKELNPMEFRKLLSEYFENVEMYGQCVRGVYSFEGWARWQRKNDVKLTDFEMRQNDFINCEVIVAKCVKRK